MTTKWDALLDFERKVPTESRRRKIERPDFTDEQWKEQIMKEIDGLNAQISDPKNTTCTHCLNISLCERYTELKILGVIK